MKLLKFSFLTAIAAMLVMGLTGSAFAFHDGGVARCEGCHTMHGTYEGMTLVGGKKSTVAANELDPQAKGDNLLQGSDPSSTCLNCHNATSAGGYHISTDSSKLATAPPVNMTPGGDFGWLKVAFNGSSTAGGNYGYDATVNEAANEHGHHINALDFGFSTATNNTVAPGGTYLAADLSCVSCHNPHNNLTLDGSTNPISGSGSYGIATAPASGTAYGVYRFLGGPGYIDGDASAEPAFTAANPVAVAPSTYNQSEATNQIKVAYGQGMSEWCANCHTHIINNDADAGTTFRHVAGAAAILDQHVDGDPVGVTVLDNYNGYVNSSNLTTGAQGSSYLSLVPYEEGTADQTILDPLAGNGSTTYAGPTGSTANVMCLSCHRAHASGFDSSTRFDVSGESFVTTDTGAYAAPQGYNVVDDTSGYYSAAYYGRDPLTTFGKDQRVLCNKCHAKG